MYEVVRKNCTILVDNKEVKGRFISKKTKDIENLLKNGYIKEVKDGKAVSK